jgi:hypothetical protein
MLNQARITMNGHYFYLRVITWCVTRVIRRVQLCVCFVDCFCPFYFWAIVLSVLLRFTDSYSKKRLKEFKWASDSSLKQQSEGRHVVPLGHIIPIMSQPRSTALSVLTIKPLMQVRLFEDDIFCNMLFI